MLYWYFTIIFIISLKGEVWGHKNSLTSQLFIGVSVPSQVSERSCICVLGCIDFVSFVDFSMGFWKRFNGVISIVYHFLHICSMYIIIYHRVPKSEEIVKSRKDKNMNIATVKSSDKCEQVMCVSGKFQISRPFDGIRFKVLVSKTFLEINTYVFTAINQCFRRQLLAHQNINLFSTNFIMSFSFKKRPKG